MPGAFSDEQTSSIQSPVKNQCRENGPLNHTLAISECPQTTLGIPIHYRHLSRESLFLPTDLVIQYNIFKCVKNYKNAMVLIPSLGLNIL